MSSSEVIWSSVAVEKGVPCFVLFYFIVGTLLTSVGSNLLQLMTLLLPLYILQNRSNVPVRYLND